ncbi:TAXI family TRAP transporter solute-binding subunit [Anoxynatronum sibiricum]|uniref:TAXI family TRAP transporter solute-binding subunit n=1 Tax=Anoxynatronum sibiricum TaxID=210623 RepID=A0ABU9VRM9_9CLOT
MQKKLALMLAVMMMLALLAGCGSPAPAPAEEPAEAPAETPAEEPAEEPAETDELTQDYSDMFVSIATGGTGGVYFPLGGALASIFNSYVPGVTANAESTGASVANVDLVGQGESEIAFIQNDITYYAYTGTEMFADRPAPIDNLRGMAVIYPELIQIVALADAGIESVEDLAGKDVAIGAPGSGTEANAKHILAAHGLTYDDLGKADFLSFAEAADQLKNKQIHAAFVTAGIPTAAITEVATTADIVIVPIDAGKIAELSSEYPFYVEVSIPGGTYPGNDDDIVTTAVQAMLVVPADLPEGLVYNMTRAMFENRQEIIDTHARGNDITLDTALYGMPIEVHPGATRYYDEVGAN